MALMPFLKFKPICLPNTFPQLCSPVLNALVYSWLIQFALYVITDSAGVDVTKSQDTPIALKREDPYIIFDVDVEIQRPLEKMPKGKLVKKIIKMKMKEHTKMLTASCQLCKALTSFLYHFGSDVTWKQRLLGVFKRVCRYPHSSSSMPMWLTEHKGRRHGKSVAFMWHHYQSAGEIRLIAL